MVTERTTNPAPAARSEAYSRTYWNGKGRYQELVAVVEAAIPVSGKVENAKGRGSLERFRKMANAYYDLYNNGGANLRSEPLVYFGVSKYDFRSEYLPSFAKAVQKIEDAMDAALLAAYIEIKGGTR